MTQLIEAMCYSRWSENTQQAGFAWRTTTIDNDKMQQVVANIQSLWDKVEYSNDIYLQGEWSSTLDIVYFGVIHKDKDENNRPCYIKEVWILEKPLWIELGAMPMWGKHHWFTSFQTTSQGETFLSNAQQIKVDIASFRPSWLPNLVSKLITTNNEILIIPESNNEIIFHTLSLLPLELKTKIPFISVGWNQSLLNVTTRFDVIFCKPQDLQETYRSLEKYNPQTAKPQLPIDNKVKQTIEQMFSSKHQKIDEPQVSHEEQLVSEPLPKRVSIVSVILVLVIVFLAAYTLNNHTHIKNLHTDLQTQTKERQNKENENTKLTLQLEEEQEKIKNLEASNTQQKNEIKATILQLEKEQKKIKKLETINTQQKNKIEQAKATIQRLKKDNENFQKQQKEKENANTKQNDTQDNENNGS